MRPPFAKPRRSKGSTDLSALWYLVLIRSTCPTKSMASMSKHSSTLSSSQKSRGVIPLEQHITSLDREEEEIPYRTAIHNSCMLALSLRTFRNPRLKCSTGVRLPVLHPINPPISKLSTWVPYLQRGDGGAYSWEATKHPGVDQKPKCSKQDEGGLPGTSCTPESSRPTYLWHYSRTKYSETLFTCLHGIQLQLPSSYPAADCCSANLFQFVKPFKPLNLSCTTKVHGMPRRKRVASQVIQWVLVETSIV